jgi:hypothetical protein
VDRIPFRERITCTLIEAEQATGISRPQLYRLIAAGKVETTKNGRRRLVLVRSILDLLEPAPAA